jgi:hypothetical protein
MTRPILTLFFGFSFLASGIAAADTVTPDAVALKVTGSVMVQLPGQPNPIALAEGAHIPQGATIITGANSEASIRPFNGAVSTIKADTTVQIEKLSVTTDNGAVSNQTALLSLLSGNLVSTLDPSKKHIDNYGVRTPKGVAAARGTVYDVQVDASGSTFATLSGTVSITMADDRIITVSLGTGLVLNDTSGATPQATPLSAASPEVKQAVLEAAATVVNLVKENLEPTTTAGATTTLLAAVVQTANAADPVASQAITTAAINAVQTNATTSGQADSSTQAIQQAATQGASLNTTNFAPPGDNTQGQQVNQTTTTVTPIDTSIVSPSH